MYATGNPTIVQGLMSWGISADDLSAVGADPHALYVLSAEIFRLRYGLDRTNDHGQDMEPFPPTSTVTPYTSVERLDVSRRIQDSLRFRGITTFGTLQMMTATELMRRCELSEYALQKAQKGMKEQGLQLRDSRETISRRARRVYGNKLRIPISYLEARCYAPAREFTERGIYWITQLTNIPKDRLSSIQNPYTGKHAFEADVLNAVESELRQLGLGFAPGSHG
jgi:hypothetical protein